MTTHTPGPWTVQYMTETFRIVGGGDDIGGAHQVAVLYHDPAPRVAERNPNASADALLIAASPALLSALEAIVEAGRMSDQPRAQYCAAIASAAITKATSNQ